MTEFLDSSALVKLYVPEEFAESVHALDGPLLCCVLAHVEVPAAFWRQSRTGAISSADAALLSTAFAYDASGSSDAPNRLHTVDLGPRCVELAAELVARHPLRAYDAVQLATALVARSFDPTIDTFVTFDHTLGRAARDEGLLLPR